MLNIIHAILLGLLQGFTEFLPVSSSAHLILLPKLLGWKDFGLSFDIALHVGSLCAIITYFVLDPQLKKDLKKIHIIRLVGLIAIATIPVGILGLLLAKYIAIHLRSIYIIAISTIFFGILLGIAYNFYVRGRSKESSKYLLELSDASLKTMLFIGLFQALALIPGGSRSGLTLTAALFLGFNLLAATRISFMLAIPVILAAGLKQTIDFWHMGIGADLDLTILAIGFISSMFSSFLFAYLFLQYIHKIGIWIFVYYRIILGGILLMFGGNS